MLLQPIITATLNVFAQPAASVPTAFTDFLRPLFLKEDEAEGAKQFATVMENPADPTHQRTIKHMLRAELEGRPESVHKLESLLGKQGITVETGIPENNDGSTK